MLAIAGDEHTRKEASDVHGSLFTIYLSGTHATAAQRGAVVRSLLSAEEEQERVLGLLALDQMLEGFHFMSAYDFSFGGRSRDYGLHPKTYGDVREWYNTGIGIVKDYLGTPLEEEVKSRLAGNFRGIWQRGWLWDELEAAFTHIAGRGFWREGWRAIRETQKFGAGGSETESYRRLAVLETVLKPNSLVEKIRGQVFSKKGGGYDGEDFEDGENDYEKASKRRIERVILLGQQLIGDRNTFSSLLPEIVTQSGLTHVLAIGLARSSHDLSGDWAALVEAFAQASVEARNENALRGFLGEVDRQNPPLANTWLDDAISSERLAECFVALQVSVNLDSRAPQRLLGALEFGKAPLWTFENLAFGRVTDQIAAADLAQILLAMLARGGHESAAHILYMRFAGDRDAVREYAEELKNVGLTILEEFDFKTHSRQRDHYLADIARRCLPGEAGAITTERLCKRLKSAVMARDLSIYDLRDVLERIFEAQPNVALNTFFSGEEKEVARAISAIEYLTDGRRPTPLGKIPNDVLISWCDLDPASRYPIIAASGMIFTFDSDGTVTGWADLANALIKNAPDPIAVVRAFSMRLRPNGFVGSYASILEHGAKLLDRLDTGEIPELVEFVRKRKAEIVSDAARFRKSEEEEHRKRDETFE